MAAQRYFWNHLSRQQVGAYAEYFVKMELTMCGFQVYSPEVDDRGIDFVTRFDSGPFLEIQVKSIRDLNQVFLEKSKFKLKGSLYLALCFLFEGKAPDLYLIPSRAWENLNGLFVSREYGEWGLNISKRNMNLLAPYLFQTVVDQIKNEKSVLEG